MSARLRTLLLVADGLALIGVVAFSVLAALEPDVDAYVVAQIASAAIVLASVLLLRRLRQRAP
ncbi:MAG: hypothetical protein AAGU78_07355 [Chloroflexota bacterium]|jgi:hypothetical protein|nr:hypothetical protein [Anaerolineae bacterium]HMM29806.1 hypothetical protein [Aggregatilineaceae bacterium]